MLEGLLTRYERSLSDAALFPRLERQTMGQRIAALLRDTIMSEALRPEAKLPSQREMAEHLGVGVPTLREAIGILVSERLLVCRQGLGTFVTRERPRRLTEVALRTASAEDLGAAREVLERRAAARAATRVDRDGDGVLRPRTLGDVAVELQHRHMGDPDRWLALDAAFHDALCRMGGRGSVLGAHVGQVILDRLRPMRSASAHRLVADDRLLKLHFDLAQAITGKNATLAAGIAGRIVQREAAALREIGERRGIDAAR
jgi:DNA-binding FadR family transcriptional regulator